MNQTIKKIFCGLLFGCLFTTNVVSAGTRGWFGQAEPVTPGQTVKEETTPFTQQGSLTQSQMKKQALQKNEPHAYVLPLEAGQFLHLTVTTNRAKIKVIVTKPNGGVLDENESRWVSESIHFYLFIPESGNYGLQLSLADEFHLPGAYQITIAARRTATPADQELVAARNLAYQVSSQAMEQFNRQNRNVPKAVEGYRKAIGLWAQIKDRTEEAVTHNVLGVIFIQTGSFQNAITELETGLKLMRLDHNRLGEAELLINLGQAYLYKSQFEKKNDGEDITTAIKLTTEGFGIRKEEQDLAGMGEAKNNLGVIFQINGNPTESIANHEEAINYKKEAGLIRGLAISSNNLAALCLHLGQTQKAVCLLAEALAFFDKLIDELIRSKATPTFEDLSDYGLLQNNLGRAYVEAKLYAQAQEHLTKALEVRSSLSGRPGELNTLNNLGAAYLFDGKYSEARQCYSQTLNLCRRIRKEAPFDPKYPVDEKNGYLPAADWLMEAGALRGIGEIDLLKGKLKEAELCLTQALDTFRQKNNPMPQAELLYSLARLEDQRGDTRKALGYIERACQVVENYRGRVVDPNLRMMFFGQTHDYYLLYIELLMRLYKANPGKEYAERAFNICEQAHARTLFERLAQAQVRKATTLPLPLSLPSIQSLLGPDTILLEFSLNRNRSFLWVVSQTGLTCYVLPDRTAILKEAKSVYSNLSSIGESSTGFTAGPQFSPGRGRLARIADQSFGPSAKRLSQMLFGKVSDPGKARLVIVADDLLSLVPFAALPDPWASHQTAGPGSPLIVNHEMVFLPSASTIGAFRDPGRTRHPQSGLVTVLGDPVFSSNKVPDLLSGPSRTKPKPKPKPKQPSTPPLQKSTPGNEVNPACLADIMAVPDHLDRLQYAGMEAAGIRLQIPPPLRCQIWLGTKATVERLQSNEAATSKILHLATHGQSDMLFFSASAPDTTPGKIGLNAISNLQLGADLVVASACKTSKGDYVKGEGLNGLTRAFMLAGSPRVIGSLWNVNDRSTAELMTLFYRKLMVEKLPPSQALRAAQCELMQREPWKSPYYWAAFQFYGEWKGFDQ